jgi:hypothetical protein
MWLELSQCVNIFVDSDTRPMRQNNSKSVPRHIYGISARRTPFSVNTNLVFNVTVEPHKS